MASREEQARRVLLEAEAATRRRLRLVPPPDQAQEDPEPDPHDVARRIVVQRLAARSRSRHELERTLSERGCDPQVAREVLDRMSEVGLVDDAAYSQAVVAKRVEGKGLSRSAVARELKTKGVTDEVAAAALAHVSPAVEREHATALAERRLKQMHGLSAEVQARRLAGVLARRGYGSDVVYAVVRDVLERSVEHQRD